MDHSLPGSFVRGFLQARILEWIAMPSSRGFSQPRVRTCILSVSPALTGGLFWDIYRYALSPLAFRGRGPTSSCPLVRVILPLWVLQSLSWFFLSWFFFILFYVPISPIPRYSCPCTLTWNPLEPFLTKYHIINTFPCHLKEKNFFLIIFKEYLIICKTWS